MAHKVLQHSDTLLQPLADCQLITGAGSGSASSVVLLLQVLVQKEADWGISISDRK